MFKPYSSLSKLFFNPSVLTKKPRSNKNITRLCFSLISWQTYCIQLTFGRAQVLCIRLRVSAAAVRFAAKPSITSSASPWVLLGGSPFSPTQTLPRKGGRGASFPTANLKQIGVLLLIRFHLSHTSQKYH